MIFLSLQCNSLPDAECAILPNIYTAYPKVNIDADIEIHLESLMVLDLEVADVDS